MDNTIGEIVDITCALKFTDLSDAAIHECKRRLIDTIGCAVSAFDADACRMARSIALRTAVSNGASVIGSRRRTLPELATFANGVMGRFLDGNDCCPGGGGHPSDAIAAVLAAAEHAGADGKATLTAIALAYDVHYRLFHGSRIFNKGLDHVLYTAVASAAGASKLLGLSPPRIRNALAIAFTSNLALGVTRRGELSMWKGCAGANAASNGVFAALLAREGITGPEAPVEGIHGLRELVRDFVIAPRPSDGTEAILKTDMKLMATEYHSQSPIIAALELSKRFALSDVEHIAINTYTFAYKETGSGAEKWRPKTRETADHSLPYTVAAVLVDGAFNPAIYEPARFEDERILRIADKISVHDDPALSRQVPNAFPCRVEFTVAGEVHAVSLQNPRGHHDNPMSDDEVTTKFESLTAGKLTVENTQRVLQALWHADECTSIAGLQSLISIDA
jgi:2-methylcitrate dehydratase